MKCFSSDRQTEIRHFAKPRIVSYAYRQGFLVKEEKGKTRQVFQHMLQLQQWGAFGCIAAEVEMKRL